MKCLILFILLILLISCSSSNYIKYEIPANLIGEEIKVILGDDISRYKSKFIYNESVKDYSYKLKEKQFFDAIYLDCKDSKIIKITLEKQLNIAIDDRIFIENIINNCRKIFQNELINEDTVGFLFSSIKYRTLYWIKDKTINIKLDYIPYERRSNLSFFKEKKVDTVPIMLTFYYSGTDKLK